MIIKLTFHESDFIHYLVEFCNVESFATGCLRARMFSEWEIPCPTLGDLDDSDKLEEHLKLWDEWSKKRDYLIDTKKSLLSPYRKHIKKGSDEEKEIIEEVLRLWDIYNKDRKVNDIPDVSIQYSVAEKDENGEVLYYFTAINQVIVM